MSFLKSDIVVVIIFAVDRDQNKELDMTEVCEKVASGDQIEQTSFLETIRLDYKAMTGDSDPVKMRRDKTPSQEIDLTADAAALENTDTDFGATRAELLALLGDQAASLRQTLAAAARSKGSIRRSAVALNGPASLEPTRG